MEQRAETQMEVEQSGEQEIALTAYHISRVDICVARLLEFNIRADVLDANVANEDAAGEVVDIPFCDQKGIHGDQPVRAVLSFELETAYAEMERVDKHMCCLACTRERVNSFILGEVTVYNDLKARVATGELDASVLDTSLMTEYSDEEYY